VKSQQVHALEQHAAHIQTSKYDKLTASKPQLQNHQAYEINVGDFVEVPPDLSTSICSHGGTGWVQEIQ
jgi:hypothetical protein